MYKYLLLLVLFLTSCASNKTISSFEEKYQNLPIGSGPFGPGFILNAHSEGVIDEISKVVYDRKDFALSVSKINTYDSVVYCVALNNDMSLIDNGYLGIFIANSFNELMDLFSTLRKGGIRAYDVYFVDIGGKMAEYENLDLTNYEKWICSSMLLDKYVPKEDFLYRKGFDMSYLGFEFPGSGSLGVVESFYFDKGFSEGLLLSYLYDKRRNSLNDSEVDADWLRIKLNPTPEIVSAEINAELLKLDKGKTPRGVVR